MTSFSNLPILNDLGEPDWGSDMGAFCEDLFGREYQGLMGMPDDSTIVYRNRDLKVLMADRATGNVPVKDQVAYFAEKLDGDPGAWRTFMNANPFTMQPPLHAAGRQILTRQLARGRATSFTALVDEIIDEVAGERSTMGEIDFQDDFAGRVTGRFWRRLMGLTVEEEDALRAATEGMLPGFQFDFSREEAESARAAAGEFMGVLGAAIMRGVDADDNQIISEMSAEFDDVDLPNKPKDIGEMLASSLFDGIHTARVAITNVIYALIENPAAKKAVDADPSLAAAAVREGLRLYSPITATMRRTTADIEHDGMTIPKDTVLLMAWCVGNRDPEAYPEPNAFRLDRKAQNQMTFGGGFQICPGRHVGTMLAEAVVRAWSEGRFDIEFHETSGWHPATTISYMDYLNVTISQG